jgi:ribosome biogenesis GTPase A
MQTQVHALQLINQLKNSLENLDYGPQRVLGSELGPHLDRLKSVVQIIRDQELIVPVIGSFSAGKSTLLNALMGDALLPIAITPETALPAELRYSEEEYLLAYTTQGQEQRHTINAIPEIQRNAEQYTLLRLYLNRPQLKALAPLVLVDMPGFNAPHDQHNKAINQYIERGVHYLLVISVDEGSLHKHTLDGLRNIVALGRSFSIALNKTDLRPEEEVEKVVEYIAQQLSDEGMTASITPVQRNDTERIKQVLVALDAEDLMRQAIHQPLLELQVPLSSALESAIRTGQRSIEDNKKALADLEQSIRALEANQAQRLEAMRTINHSERSDSVISAVETVLNSSSKALALEAKRSPDQLQSTVRRLVQNAMIQALAAQTADMEGALLEEFKKINISTLRVDLQLDDDWISLANSHIHNILPSLLAKVININWLAILVTTIISIISNLFHKGREEDRIAEAIRNQMIPGILDQIRPQVEQIIAEFYRKAWNTLNDMYTSELQSRKNAMQEAIRNYDVATQTQFLSELQDTITAAKNLLKA